MRVAVVASHPIQYQAPWFRALARATNLEVFFCHRQDAAGQAAAGYGVPFDWDVPLLDGYSSQWLENISSRPGVSSFSGCDTPSIVSRLKAGNFSACIVCGWYLKSYLQAIRGAGQLGIPLLSRGDSQLPTRRPRLWSLAKYLPYRWLLGSIDAHLYVGNANREYLQHYGVTGERLFFAPHFVDNDRFATAAADARMSGAAAAVRSAHSIPEDAFVLLFAGRFVGMKRPLDAIRALGVLAAREGMQRAPWMLFAGDGPLRNDLQQEARTFGVNVRFAGFQNQSALPAHYAAADALVLPSDAGETWGLVTNEAMACGLPAIVSDACGCSRDLIDDGRTGFVYPCADIEALADRIGRLAALMKSEGSRLREHVVAKADDYSCPAAVKGTLAALEAVHRPTRAKHRVVQQHA